MRLRERSDSLHSRCEPVSVYRDDLDYIIKSMEGAGLNVELGDEQWHYDNLDELAERQGRRPKKLGITATKPEEFSHYSLSVGFEGARATVFSTSPELFGTLPHRIEALLKGRSLKSVAFFTSPWWGAVIFVVSMVGVQLGRAEARIHSIYLVVFGVVFGAVVLGAFSKRTLGGIHLNRRHEGGYFKRNSDRILMVALTAVITELVTLAALWLTGKFGK